MCWQIFNSYHPSSSYDLYIVKCTVGAYNAETNIFSEIEVVWENIILYYLHSHCKAEKAANEQRESVFKDKKEL